MVKHSFEYCAPSEVHNRHRAWRVHSKHQVSAARQSLRQHGFVQPILVDKGNRVVCGALMLEAARLECLNEIPVQKVDDLSDEQLRLYAITANRLADMGAYDESLLAEELSELLALVPNVDLDSLAIPQAELDRLLGLTISVDEVIDASGFEGPPVSRCGDMWNIGEHRILHGDALNAASYEMLLAGEKADLILSDVPYNLPASEISGHGKHKHANFIQAAGEMSPHEFTRFLTSAMRLMARHSRDGSLHAFFMSYQYLLELLRAGNVVYGRPKAICTWIKSQGGMGALYRSQTEFIAFFKNGKGRHTNNIMLGAHGRTRTTAWQYEGMNSFSAERDELLALHPTPKPVSLLQDAILDVTRATDLVLDPFAGTGSLILAAHGAGRRGFAIELDGKYVDAALRRASKSIGIDPVRAVDGARFSELELLAEGPVA